jgi:hypothetical protein
VNTDNITDFQVRYVQSQTGCDGRTARAALIYSAGNLPQACEAVRAYSFGDDSESFEEDLRILKMQESISGLQDRIDQLEHYVYPKKDQE